MSKDQARQKICARVAELLCEERQRKGMSMTVTAAKAGLSQPSLSYIERHLRIPTLDTLLRLADALEIDLGGLIQRAVKDSGGL